MSSAIVDLLGSTLVKGGAEVQTADVLAGKTLGLYFSAHWCPPCKGFTPMLAKAYTEHLKAKNLEIVFVSSDKSQAEFESYFKEMPWLAAPFGGPLKAKLSKKYKVQGIPTLVIVDADGKTITTDGREAVDDDPTGANFPWTPPTLWDSLGSEFLKGTDGETVELDELKASSSVIGLYFSAHWCGPCRSFTPKLIEAYNTSLKAKGLEVIFVSSDRSPKEFSEYYGEMPWLAIPNGDPRKEKLSKLFGVRGIPSFVLLDTATGETISANARGRVMADPSGAEFPWRPKPLVDMVAEGPEGINEEVALCVMMEGAEQPTREAAIAALEPIAAAYKEAGDTAPLPGLLFLYAPSTGGPTEQIRALTKLGAPSATPQMVLLDIPDDGGFYTSPATEVTAETVNGFLEAYKAKALERKQLG